MKYSAQDFFHHQAGSLDHIQSRVEEHPNADFSKRVRGEQSRFFQQEVDDTIFRVETERSCDLQQNIGNVFVQQTDDAEAHGNE